VRAIAAAAACATRRANEEEDRMATVSIQLSALIPAAPKAVYDAWMSSEGHAAMTGGEAAMIDPRIGGQHSAWNGYISGETLELVPGKRIVQSWHAGDFPEGAPHSRLVVSFAREGKETRVTIDHAELPEGMAAGFLDGWEKFYFTPMRSYFGTPAAAEGEKPAAKKAAKKPAAKKPAAKKVAGGPVAKKPVAKKPATKKAAKKPVAKKPVAKKAAKKPAAKKPAKKA
jgi:uncharacterized protein YndB with AHSA1/START domain